MKKKGVYLIQEPGCLNPTSGAFQHINMGLKYLGKEFDIHGGGMDLKFPHHECEIAQGQAANGKNPVNYWMHANMLTLNGKKMAKSTGNNILPTDLFSGDNDILSKPFSPSVARFFMLVPIPALLFTSGCGYSGVK